MRYGPSAGTVVTQGSSPGYITAGDRVPSPFLPVITRRQQLHRVRMFTVPRDSLPSIQLVTQAPSLQRRCSPDIPNEKVSLYAETPSHVGSSGTHRSSQRGFAHTPRDGSL